jgi:UDP-GlcNAc:undecaprenyl-phosphate/decaprenyl-phosphate GlcNAc-1-phosphate transferase
MDGVILLGFGIAAVVTFVAMKVLAPVAQRLGLVDRPGGRKLHESPTPLTGGLAMLFGFVIALAFIPSVSPTLVPFAFAAAMLVAVGCIDDRYDVPWWVRLLVQCAAVLVMVYGAGVYLHTLGPVFGHWPLHLGWFAVPFTLFAAVGVINALNMADGSDGLAGSLAFCSLALFVGAAVYSGHHRLVFHILPLLGALAAFLWFNLRTPWQHRARAFMGDAGSMLLGFTIAWVAIHLTQTPRHPVPQALAPWLVAIPIIDCLAVSVHRMRLGRSPFSPDRRHFHHMMADAGFSPTRIAIVLSVATLVVGAGAAVAIKLGVPRIVMVWLFIALIVAYTWFSARRERVVALLRGLRRSDVEVPDSATPAESHPQP